MWPTYLIIFLVAIGSALLTVVQKNTISGSRNKSSIYICFLLLCVILYLIYSRLNTIGSKYKSIVDDAKYNKTKTFEHPVTDENTIIKLKLTVLNDKDALTNNKNNIVEELENIDNKHSKELVPENSIVKILENTIIDKNTIITKLEKEIMDKNKIIESLKKNKISVSQISD